MPDSLVIFDVDGTLADHRWRIDMIEWGDDAGFERYHRNAHLDAPINLHLLIDVPVHRRVLLTRMPEHHRPQRAAWLARHGIEYAELIMAPTGDRRPPRLFKLAALADIRERHAPRRVLLAYDDDAAVCEMFAAEGVNCVQIFS
jgi:hypothetical protein